MNGKYMKIIVSWFMCVTRQSLLMMFRGGNDVLLTSASSFLEDKRLFLYLHTSLVINIT